MIKKLAFEVILTKNRIIFNKTWAIRAFLDRLMPAEPFWAFCAFEFETPGVNQNVIRSKKEINLWQFSRDADQN